MLPCLQMSTSATIRRLACNYLIRLFMDLLNYSSKYERSMAYFKKQISLHLIPNNILKIVHQTLPHITYYTSTEGVALKF